MFQTKFNDSVDNIELADIIDGNFRRHYNDLVEDGEDYNCRCRHCYGPKSIVRNTERHKQKHINSEEHINAIYDFSKLDSMNRLHECYLTRNHDFTIYDLHQSIKFKSKLHHYIPLLLESKVIPDERCIKILLCNVDHYNGNYPMNCDVELCLLLFSYGAPDKYSLKEFCQSYKADVETYDSLTIRKRNKKIRFHRKKFYDILCMFYDEFAPSLRPILFK
jgi:hypothetical protein